MIARRFEPGPLAAVLPNRSQTLLLQSCLLPGDAARASWEEWLRKTSRTKAALQDVKTGFRRLLALLGYRLRQNRIEVDPEVRVYLRAARVREQLRSEGVRELCRRTLGALAAADAPAIVLRGVMAAETLYPDPALRHCHDLDLMIGLEYMDAAALALEAAGFSRQTARVWRHSSGFPVSIQHTLFRVAALNEGLPDPAAEAMAGTIAGVPAKLLCPAVNLLHFCAHAATTGSHVSPNWAADACFLLERHPEIPWQKVLEWSSRGALALPLTVTLGYLSSELKANIPRFVLDALEDNASRQPWRAAWFAALRSAEGRPLALLRASRGIDRCRAFFYLARRATRLLEIP